MINLLNNFSTVCIILIIVCAILIVILFYIMKRIGKLKGYRTWILNDPRVIFNFINIIKNEDMIESKKSYIKILIGFILFNLLFWLFVILKILHEIN